MDHRQLHAFYLDRVAILRVVVGRRWVCHLAADEHESALGSLRRDRGLVAVHEKPGAGLVLYLTNAEDVVDVGV